MLHKCGLLGRNLFRCYSSKPLIGPRFTSLNEIKAYIFEDSLSANEYLTKSESQRDQLQIPSRQAVVKLCRLSGLPSEDADIERIQRNLSKQISFIDILHNTHLNEEVDENHARLVPRHTSALSYKELMLRIAANKEMQWAAEQEESWDSTSVAALEKDHYFVIREDILENKN
ncbi:GTF1 (YGR102C) [Zygosaccharomyces parabailii]|nr:GTF1 (YGR102C) [Zygosaccharomyces parabailii]CDH12460.1 related to Glutamyl-tRNA(Gln) amidotransferase subunit F, mitochondrial [Zygosaccharomyces bailii ISA1307]